jgi:hypothetical protein
MGNYVTFDHQNSPKPVYLPKWLYVKYALLIIYINKNLINKCFDSDNNS